MPPSNCTKTQMGLAGFTMRCGRASGGGRLKSVAETFLRDCSPYTYNTQSMLPPGATVAPVILSSDKTQLSRFSGDKQAWPVYLSLGNIAKNVRRQPSKRAMLLIGYIPVTKLECFAKGRRRSLEGYRLFHECMRAILAPLIEAGKDGVEVLCADGMIRRVHPIVAAYIADHPEQCLVSGCQENFCPKCTVHADNLGDPLHSVMKEPESVWRFIDEQVKGEKPPEFKSLGLRLIDPFWRDLPHCDIFSCITPDLLHQLHKGVFKDHTVSWSTDTRAMEGGPEELDRRFKAMPSHPALRHFKRGISLVSQWTGTEYKHMEKVFVGAITGACPPSVMRAVRAVLDFIYYAHFEAHSEHSLSCLQSAWATFHANKHVFKDLNIREHFNIPKVHSADHYALSIRNLGTADGFNTEGSERLHIDYAKRGYAASNKPSYIKQMTIWLDRQEAVSRFQAYLDWAEPLSSRTCSDATENGEAEVDEDGDGDVAMQPPPTAGQGAQDASRYVVSKVPGLPGTSVRKLVSDFGCTNFIHALEAFLRDASTTRSLPVAAQNIHAGSRFAVYKRMYLFLPPLRQISRLPIKDTVRAVPAQRTRPLVPATPAHFDTVLACRGPGDPGGENPLQGEYRFSLSDAISLCSHAYSHRAGICVARVRAIFRLPDLYGPQFTNHPVAYVEWFTPFRQRDPETGMFKVSHSTRNFRRHASIIPITQILRSCHLLPVWGKRADPTWTSSNVLDKCTRFFVNPYLRHHDFVLFKYLQETRS